MAIPFEFVIDGPPVSQQARRGGKRREWTEEVHAVASRSWDAEQPFNGPLAVTITYFYDRVELDVDNIPKPVLDALKGLIYADDSQVFDLICRKRNLNDNPQVRNPSPELLERLVASRSVLHISVINALNLEVAF